MDSGYSKWRKLDNAALAFPLVTGKDDTRVFRFYCELKEPVEEADAAGSFGRDDEALSAFSGSAAKGTFLVLSGAERDPSCRTSGKKAAMQQTLYSG